MEGKECKDQKRLKTFRRKSMPEQGRCFSMGLATLSGPVVVDEERFVAAVINSTEEKEKQKEK